MQTKNQPPKEPSITRRSLQTRLLHPETSVPPGFTSLATPGSTLAEDPDDLIADLQQAFRFCLT